jgi:hypothetical protein
MHNSYRKKNYKREYLKEIGHLNSMADQIEALNLKLNDGRGMSCVKQIIDSLRAGKFEDAKNIASNEHNKFGKNTELDD